MKRTLAAILRPRALRIVLGLLEPNLPNGERVRAARLGDVRRMLPVARASALFNAVVLSLLLWGVVPAWQMLLWLCGVLATFPRAGRTAADAVTAGTAVPARLARAGLRASVCGTVWALAPALLALGRGPQVELAVCVVMGAVLAGAAFTLSALPLAMAGFAMPVAIGLATMLGRTGSALLATLPLIYVGALLVAGLAIGRGALRRRVAETALAEEAEIVSLLLHEFTENGADWLWEIDIRKRLVNVSPRLAQALGRSVEALHERPLIGLLADGWPDGHPPELRALLDLLDGRNSFKDRMLPLMIAGERRWWRLSATPRYATDGSFCGFRGVGADATEQGRRIERINRLARADGLTEIDNRRGFMERLRSAIERIEQDGPPCALVLIDLDRFKAVNDTYGHPTGDKLLRAAAARLVGLVPPGGGCGRLGGDEFAMLVPDAEDGARLADLVRRTQQALTQGFEIDGTLLHIGASIGVAVAPRDGGTVEALMHNADLALYHAKRDGGGAPRHFAPDMGDRDARRARLDADLPDAFATGKLTLAYAPLVGAADGRLTAFAATPHWSHPDYGPIATDELLSVADVRLQHDIAAWMLRAACKEAAGWSGDVRLLIGLSPAQARAPGLAAAIRDALTAAWLAPDRLVLGLPEAVVADAGAMLDRTLAALREIGVRVALDRFEAGFGLLRGARFATVRTRPSLLDDAGRGDPESIAVVRALVTMADALGVETIVVGDDSPIHRTLALRLGCGLIESPARPGRPTTEKADDADGDVRRAA